ncbi:putative ribosomal export complex protein [Suhomyces tanzawaensis NRRL Y-17324]|uniref:Probable metalloprotease ARX1 n=1 Tax=Suhomyces tanzawaensis NRRL Y-17324 TaxID=984487 RepID=A0A1E4SLG7_9ASCO|nr:putative ribosomal export complex protein [Suhomyces tanzawaensis NRRL Y-17324]ODV80356.1 putative ribosomal export complex protein [Suhomyces tanzawaensis NRRL Y-17324]
MQLAVHQDDADILLKQKNILDDSVLNKYRVAGQISQSGLQYIINLINDSYHYQKSAPVSVQELCLLGDSYLTKLLGRAYNNVIREKGIAHPTTIDVNELSSGFAPELDDETAYTFTAGDVVTISLGVQIDGYTATASHTIVIYPGGDSKPAGPLLGGKADAICAAHIATETMVALLGMSLSPEKLPQQLAGGVTGSKIRAIVDSIAESFNCVVLPGSKIRRVRRFLAGQAEGVVAERDFKGVVWDESHQEEKLLKKSIGQELVLATNITSAKNTDSNNAIPSDEFSVAPGEVYQVDIRMASLSDVQGAGIITTEEIDEFTGKKLSKGFNSKSTLHIRDFAINHQLRLKTSRRLLAEVDKKFSVYPFKLSHTSKTFPIKEEENIPEQLDLIKKDIRTNRLGLSELSNRHLVKSKPIQITKFIPLDKILLSANPTGKHGMDMDKPVLPGMELPLPQLGVSSLLLKNLLRHGQNIANVREATTLIINENGNEVIRLTGGEKTSKPSWVHSQYQLAGEYAESINQIVELSKDQRFGIKIKECAPYKLQIGTDSMQLDE